MIKTEPAALPQSDDAGDASDRDAWIAVVGKGSDVISICAVAYSKRDNNRYSSLAVIRVARRTSVL